MSQVCLIVERYRHEKYLPAISKGKFLVPRELTFSQLSQILRTRLQISCLETLFLFVNDRVLPAHCTTMAELHRNHRDADGFVYITYASQEVFGR